MSRPFRTADSLRAEVESRKLIKPLLESRGFTDVEDHRKKAGNSQEQTLFATSPDGARIGFSIRLCWRHGGKRGRHTTLSASQLMARLPQGRSGVEAIDAKVKRCEQGGATHMLFVQPEGRSIIAAAIVPLGQVVRIWSKQREESDRLIKDGKLGRRRKNHAENGRSPTLWLRDDNAPSVAAALWNAPGVTDVVRMPLSGGGRVLGLSIDDTFNDLPVDVATLGTDHPGRQESYSSSIRRDHRVRRAVLQRAQGKCERQACGAAREFPGFLDVHHVLGAARSDRVYNCVALCPNCHREAHFHPNRELINQELLRFAAKFRK